MIRSFILFITAFAAGFLNAEDKIPPGFEIQVLEPTGGRILRPEGWFYNEGHGKSQWTWTVSREDTEGGTKSYDTGVRIQAMVGVEERTGKSPEVFVREFVSQKKSSADIVHKICDPADQGLFKRICIEVTEGDYRILYSAMWGKEMDIAVISIAGAKAPEWEVNSKFFDVMSVFELIDMERFPSDVGNSEGKQAGGAKQGFLMESLALYQSDDVLKTRVSSVKDLGAYVKEIQRVCDSFFEKTTIPESLNIVIAIRPNKTSKAWFISSIHLENPRDREALLGALEKVPPFEVTGPVAFALVSTIAGGDGKTITQPSGGGAPPVPREWKEAADRKPGAVILPDGILDEVWPVKK